MGSNFGLAIISISIPYRPIEVLAMTSPRFISCAVFARDILVADERNPFRLCFMLCYCLQYFCALHHLEEIVLGG